MKRLHAVRSQSWTLTANNNDKSQGCEGSIIGRVIMTSSLSIFRSGYQDHQHFWASQSTESINTGFRKVSGQP